MVNEAIQITTRESLHAVAELVLAGAQHAACQRITLRSTPGGFGTRFEPELRVQDTDLVGGFGRIALDGATPRTLCAAAGVPLTDLSEVYSDGAALGPDDVLRVDAGAALLLAAAWALGHEALQLVAPGSQPVLWPEHFDVGISVGEVNLGVSPGDAFLPVPYAYVGPWRVPENDAFFDAPFGSARTVSQFESAAALAAYYEDGLRHSAGTGKKDIAKNL